MQGSSARRGRRFIAAGAVGALTAGVLAAGVAGPASAVRPFVTGVVTNAAGQPLGGANVTVYDAATGNPVQFASTDVDGGYKAFVAPSVTSVKVEFARFTRQSLYAEEFYNDKPSLAAADPIAVSPAGADLGATVLTAGGTVSGVVTNEAGVPLDRVRVTVFGTDVSGGGGDYTDATGAYAVPNLPAGSYRVEFSDDDVDEYASEYFDNTTFGSATPVVVGKDAAVGGINAALAAQPVVAPVSGPDITGRVVDSAGVPAVGVEIEAWSVGPRQRDGEVLETTYTNRTGAYVLDALDTLGATSVKIRYAGYRDELVDFQRFGGWSGGSQSYEGAPVVSFVPGAAPTVADLTPQVAGGVSGRVTTPAGAPAQLASVLVSDVQGNTLGSTQVDPDGTFELKDLAPTAAAYVKFDADELVAQWWKNAATKERSTSVRIRGNAVVGSLDAALSPTLKTLEAPSIQGFPVVGKALFVDPGEWNQQDGSLFSYQWLVGSTVVGTGDRYTPTTADIGKRLRVRVTNNPGTARVYVPASVVTKASERVGYASRLKVRIKGQTATFEVKASKVKEKKVKGRVVVQIKDGDTIKEKVLGKAKIKRATGRMSLAKLLKRLDSGKSTVVFTFSAKTKKVGSDAATTKIRKKRR